MPLLTDRILAWRHLLALATVVLGGAVTWGAVHTRIESGFDSIVIEGDPIRDEVRQVREDFPPTTAIVFAFLPKSGDVFSLEMLGAMDDLTKRYAEVESAIAVGSLLNQRLNAVDAGRLDRDYLVPELSTLAPGDVAGIREIALADDVLTKTMLSPEGDMALAVIKYRASDDDQATRLRVARSAIALRDSLRAEYPEASIYVLGEALFELEGYEAQIEDTRLLFPLVMAISILVMWFCLRSLSFSLCLYVVALATIGLTVGTVGWAGVAFNQISTMAPLVVVTIAMADGIHIVAIYVQGLHQNLGRIEAMRQSLAANLQPITLTTATTATGFLSLNYCSSPGIYGFGNVVAIGVGWAYVVTLTLLPTLILLLPVRKTPQPLGLRGFIDGVVGLVAQRGEAVFRGGAALIVTTLALLPLNQVDFDRFHFIDESSDFHHVIQALSEKIGNDQSLVYSVNSGAYYGITEPEFLGQVDAFSRWLEDQPEASFVTSYTDLLRVLNKAEHDGDESFDALPEDKLQIIDHLVGYQLIQEIEPNLEPIFNADYSAVRLAIGTSRLSNQQLMQFNERIEGWLATHLDPAYEVKHGDHSLLFARLNHAISVELLSGFTVSFALITLTLVLGLKSVRYGLLSIAPNLFPATIVFGFWGLFVGQLSPYVLMLFSISLGLVVDDSVHVLSKYVSARRGGSTPEFAVRYALETAGSAITITTISLALGTLVLVFSNTFYYQNVAQLLTPIIVVAWLLDLSFLPALLVRLDNWF